MNLYHFITSPNTLYSMPFLFYRQLNTNNYRYYQSSTLFQINLSKISQLTSLTTYQNILPQLLSTMKNHHKLSTQNFIHKLQSIQIPQFSTVFEVNPSCQSQSIIYQKITSNPNQNKKHSNIHNPNHQKHKILTQRNINLPNCIHEKNQLKNNQNIIKDYQTISYTKRHNPILERQNQQNFIKIHQLKKQTQNNRYDSYSTNKDQKEYFSCLSQTEEQNLMRIQEKIRNHQMKQNRKKNFQHHQTHRRNSLQDTMEKQLSKVQIYHMGDKMKKKQTIIDQIKDEYIRKQDLKSKSIRKQNHQFRIDKQQPTIRNRLQTVYDSILVDKSESLSPTNINLNRILKEQIKLVLGPIFADITIKGKTISKSEFIQRAHELLNKYTHQQIQQIFSSLINPFIKNNHHQQINFTINQTKSIELNRVPGKLLKNSKTSFENYHQTQRNKISNTQTLFSMENAHSSSFSSKKYSTNHPSANQRIYKQPYIQKTQRTQPEDSFKQAYERSPQGYKTKINLNNQALQIMINQQRTKRNNSSLNKIQHSKIKVQTNDDQLERLNKLQKRFKQHFSTQGGKKQHFSNFS